MEMDKAAGDSPGVLYRMEKMKKIEKLLQLQQDYRIIV
jgi:hypothetical protein